jgi:regulator of RNase E activity RraB
VLMTILSEHFSVSYDGWGSMVANEIQWLDKLNGMF